MGASSALVALLLSSSVCFCGATPKLIDPIDWKSSAESCSSPQVSRDDLSSRVRRALQCDPGRCQENPAQSCTQLFSSSSDLFSGYYWLERCDGTAFRAYCVRDSPCGCSGNTTGWKRVAFVNTTDSNQACPGGTKPFSSSLPIRTCARLTHGCVSLTYGVDFMPYSRVCGRIIGYQHRSPDGFTAYHDDQSKTLDNNYVDGVSVTYGYPRKHIWTFVAGLDETSSDFRRCPCANRNSAFGGVIPPFIGNDYFCETGSRTRVGAIFYRNDPLWDGEGCGSVSTCCSNTTAPWFCKTLPRATRENVEIRLCGDEDTGNENIPIQLIELYVQ